MWCVGQYIFIVILLLAELAEKRDTAAVKLMKLKEDHSVAKLSEIQGTFLMCSVCYSWAAKKR